MFVINYNIGGTNNVLQNKVINIVPKVQPSTSEARNKPPILSRKPVTETPILTSPIVANILQSTPKVIANPPITPKFVLRYPEKQQMADPSLYDPTKMKQVNNTVLTVPENLINSSVKASPQVFRNPVYVCQPLVLDSSSLKNSLPISLKTPPQKKPRKTPLGARIFKESPEIEKRLKDLVSSDEEVDVDTVDEKFDPQAELRKAMEESDVSDVECDEIFSTNIQQLMTKPISDTQKSINERKRRLAMKKLLERLKMTDPLFLNARSFKDILAMAAYAVDKYKRKELAIRQAKRILRIQNARLLEQLTSNLKGFKDTDTMNQHKRRIITAVANDWVQYRQERADAAQLKRQTKSVNASQPVDPAPSEIVESERVVSQQLDFEVDESYNTDLMPAAPKLEEVEMADETEQPHVQLRILEMPETENVDPMEAELDIKIEEKQPSPKKEEVVQDNTKQVDKTVGGPYENLSDDDLLIIDLDESNTNQQVKTSPIKEKSTPEEVPPPMGEFPGLEPLFPPEYYEKDNPYAIDLSKFSTTSNPADEANKSVEQVKGSSGKMALEKLHLKPKTAKYELSAIEKATRQLEALTASTKARRTIDRVHKPRPDKEHKSRPSADKEHRPRPAPVSLSPRSSIHRSCKDVKVLHGLADVPIQDDSEPSSPETAPSVPTEKKLPSPVKKVIQEEIIIDDSDDESMDVTNKTDS